MRIHATRVIGENPKEKRSEMTDPNENSKTPPGPWPWYVLFVLGYCFTGLLPWLFALWAAFRRGMRRTAVIGLVPNLAVYGLMSWYAVESRAVWQWISASIFVVNLLWTAGAWFFQRRVLGAAPSRYVWSERSLWIPRLAMGLATGVCLAVIVGIPGALSRKQEMWAARDVLDRDSVLWIILQNSWKGVPLGLLLGAWWAGEGRRFRISHIVTFLSAWWIAPLFSVFSGLLLAFLFMKGSFSAGSVFQLPDWAPIPPWIAGWSRALMRSDGSPLFAYLVISLLFGAVSRLRDFFKRLLWLPAVLLLSLPFICLSHEWWSVFQAQIIYDMSSPVESVRSAACERAATLLLRYPDHLRWPAIAGITARRQYEAGRFDAARTLYETTSRRFAGVNQWRWEVKTAEAAVASTRFGDSGAAVRMDIPMVDSESYLTHNWMALLCVIRYWEGPKASDSDVKIRLKALSKSDDKIELPPLTEIAEFDDAVRSLNYRMAILPMDLAGLKSLIAAGVPVVIADRSAFRVVYGFDDSRCAMLFYGFDALSYQTIQEGRREAKEILAVKDERGSENKERLDRIRLEAEGEYGVSAPEDPALKHRAPFMLAIYPESDAGRLSKALGRPIDAMLAESDAYLAALIGLTFLRHADPVAALEWAKTGSRQVSSPFPMHVAHLSRLYWQSREKRVRTRLPLEDQFPELKAVEATFDAPETRAFLDDARRGFEADFEEGKLPGILLEAFERTLLPNDPDDRILLARLGEMRVAIDSSDVEGWRMLTKTYEQTGNAQGRIRALEGLAGAEPLNFNAKLDLAFALAIQGEIPGTESTIKTIDTKRVRFNPDYPFCRGAVSEWKGERSEALRYYKEAIDMRRYKPAYHLRYGRLLLAEGRHEEAEKALRWAARIDAAGDAKEEASKLLAGEKN